MENRINKIVTLKDGRRMFVVNQANYQNRIFLLVNELVNEDLSEKFFVLEEKKENDSIYLELVSDKEMLEKVIKAFEGAL